MKRILVLFKESESAISINLDNQKMTPAMLKCIADESQRNFLEKMSANSLCGLEAKQNWLVNGIWMYADDEDIEMILQRDDVKGVQENQKINRVVPIEYTADESPIWLDDSVSTWGLKAIRALEAREAFGVSGSGIRVGILDTGLASHPDLDGKLALEDWKDCTNRNESRPYDGNGHGTHCAGTICGNPLSGMQIGVAPKASLVVGKILSDRGHGYVEWILEGMQWIATRNVGMVSNSWGSSGMQGAFHDAVKAWRKLGILPVFAAGNNGPRSGTVGSPGGFEESFAIGATTNEEKMAHFSSRGPVRWGGKTYVKPNVSAPGKNVTSCSPKGGYWTISGTSMATPHVTGLCALVKEKNPGLSIDAIQSTIEKSAVRHSNTVPSNDWGYGRIDCMTTLALS